MGLIGTLFDFQGGTPAYADQVDSNFAAIRNEVNGNLDAANLKSGAVTPAKVATIPRVKAAVSVGQTLTAGGGGGRAALGTAEFDTDNLYDDVNDYFTVVTAGVYHVHLYLVMNALTGSSVALERRPGGGTPVIFAQNANNTNNTAPFMSLSGMDYFAAGDQIDFTWLNQGPGAATTSGGFLMASWGGP
jgi:hypothetical protein